MTDHESIPTIRPGACPRCQYNLCAMPAVERCSECGFQFGRGGIVLIDSLENPTDHARLPIWTKLLAVIMTLMLCVLCLSIIGPWLGGLGSGWTNIIVFISALSIVGIAYSTASALGRRFRSAPSQVRHRTGDPVRFDDVGIYCASEDACSLNTPHDHDLDWTLFVEWNDVGSMTIDRLDDEWTQITCRLPDVNVLIMECVAHLAPPNHATLMSTIHTWTDGRLPNG